jgi:hypothetical protein
LRLSRISLARGSRNLETTTALASIVDSARQGQNGCSAPIIAALDRRSPISGRRCRQHWWRAQKSPIQWRLGQGSGKESRLGPDISRISVWVLGYVPMERWQGSLGVEGGGCSLFANLIENAVALHAVAWKDRRPTPITATAG